MRFILLFCLSLLSCRIVFAYDKDSAVIMPIVNKATLMLTKEGPDSNMRQTLDTIYKLSQASNYYTGLAWYHLLIGKIAMFRADNDRGKSHYEEALFYNTKGEKDARLFGNVYMNMGTLEVNKGNLEDGLSRFLKALDYATQIKGREDRELLTAAIYSNLSRPFMNVGKYTKALDYLNKGQAMADRSESLGIVSTKITILNNQGLCYQFLGDYKQAMDKYQAARLLSITYHRLSYQQTALANIGNLLIIQGKYQEAIQSIKQALAIDDRSKPYYTTGILSALGNGYLHVGDARRAEQTWLEALSLAREFELKSYFPELHLSLSDLYERKKQSTLALKHLKQYILYKDSISRSDQIKNIQQLEAKYQSAVKDKALVENQVILQRRNNLIILLVSVGALLFVLAYAVLRHRGKLNKRKIRILEQMHEIKAVKYMMEGEEKERIRIARELHDGIGSMLTALNMKLNSIKKKYALKGADIYAELNDPIMLTMDISAEIRQTSRNLVPETLLHLGLAGTLRQYCTYLEANNHIQVDLQIYGDIDQINHSLSLSLYRIVQEIAQNIIKHAQATEAVIQVRRHEDRISLYAEDNGTGFEPKNIKRKGGGLANIQARVNALKGYFSISSSVQSGTTIHIEMDIGKVVAPKFELGHQPV